MVLSVFVNLKRVILPRRSHHTKIVLQKHPQFLCKRDSLVFINSNNYNNNNGCSTEWKHLPRASSGPRHRIFRWKSLAGRTLAAGTSSSSTTSQSSSSSAQSIKPFEEEKILMFNRDRSGQASPFHDDFNLFSIK